MTTRRANAWRGLWTASVALVSLSHCVEGGLNQNEHTAGNSENGVEVGFGELAIDPTGTYVLSRSEDALVYGDLETGKVEALTDMDLPERVAFAHEGHSIFATRAMQEGGRVFRYDLRTGQEAWSRGIALELAWDDEKLGTRPWLDVLEDDSKLVLTFADHVQVMDAKTGARLFESEKGRAVVDVDITPDQQRLVVTRDHVWAGEGVATRIEVVDLASFETRSFDVPNCADELTLSRDGKRAFLAPTTCDRDPVSVLDLEAASFVRNLPGFGPVALAPSGELAVAFLDVTNVDEALFDDPAQIPDAAGDTYHLMLIDTNTLAFDTIALGDTLPRYTVSPDGKMLLVDGASFLEDGRIRVLDVKTRQLAAVQGPDIRLENYVVTRDSRTVYLLDRGLYEVSLDERSARAEQLEFTPDHLNITPDDRILVLREDERTLWLYDTAQGKLTRSLHIEL